MSIRKHPTQPGVWQIIVTQGRKGKQLVYPFACSEAEAMIKDKEINARIKGERMTAFPTIAETLPDYLVYYKTIASEGIVKDMISVMKRQILPHFGRYQVSHIIPQTVYAYTSKRLSDPCLKPVRTKAGTTLVEQAGKVSHRTIEKELNYLSAMTRWMYLNGQTDKLIIIPKPPKAKTQPKKVQQPLAMAELSALLAAVPATKQVLVLLMSDAGLREAEALGIETGNIDLAGWRLTVHGKMGKVLVYPILTNRLHEALAAAVANGTKHLCPNPATGKPYASIKTLLRLASKRAGITKHVTHHTLRHTFSTLLMESGISTEARKVLMRHSSLAATEKYTHTSPAFMASQAGTFTDMINSTKVDQVTEV